MKPRPEHFTAIIDTREQDPWELSPMRTEVGTLPTGDYSLRGMENSIAIERKSLPDFLSCVGRNRERFEREVQRLLAYPTRALVIESTWYEIETGNYKSEVHPRAATGSIIGWIARGLPVVLARNHANAGQLVQRLLFTTARRRIEENQTLLSQLTKGD